jgi:hypothetical protein
MYLHDSEIRGMKQVMASWASQLQAAKDIKSLHSQFGWDGKTFITAAGKYSADGVAPADMADPTLQKYYSPVGDMELWKRAADVVMNNEHVELHAMVASAFAAPLIHFSGVNGAILSVISKRSGTGKTSAMRVAQSVWGHPIHGINSLNDTTNSVSHRMATLNNLPLYWDELRQRKEVTDFLGLVFRTYQGRDKTRLTRSASQMQAGSWRTLIAVASNEPLKDYVDTHVNSTDAGMLRIFEMEMKTTASREFDPVTSGLFTKLDNNFGHAGQVYAEYLAQNYEKIHSMLVQVEDKFTKEIKVEQHQRFWVSTMAALYLGAALAKQLNLVNFDLPKLKQCLIDTAIAMRDVTKGSLDNDGDSSVTSSDLVQQFMHEMSDYTYITEHFPDTKGEVGQFIKLPERSPVKIYIGKDENRARLDKAAFRKWLSDNKRTSLSVFRELKESYGAVEARAMMSPKYGSGSDTNLRTYTIEFPLTGL